MAKRYRRKRSLDCYGQASFASSMCKRNKIEKREDFIRSKRLLMFGCEDMKADYFLGHVTQPLPVASQMATETMNSAI